MRTTLLDMVQSILSDMDSEAVNSIEDSDEALQVAEIIQTTFYNMTAARLFPEHNELLKLTALADSNYPTHFTYESENAGRTRDLCKVEYNIDTSSGIQFREIKWKEPLDFLNLYTKSDDHLITVFDNSERF